MSFTPELILIPLGDLLNVCVRWQFISVPLPAAELVIAKLVIAAKWKDAKPPTLVMWHEKNGIFYIRKYHRYPTLYVL